ncbi:MAG: sugar transferase [Candidatus Krumholzibacteriota bacterium]|nr:sugar transferase [Candidatus Krumholzibacteriota bacterium]
MELLSIRIFDILASLSALLLLSPLFGIIMLLIKIEDRGPVFFSQKRIGFMGRPFRILKFRSMVVDAEKTGNGHYIEGSRDARITRIGGFLRRTSLDELTQLINIAGGRMSLVGPRPGLDMHVRQYTGRQKGRLTVKPGLTGWAQINGRNSLSWPERIEHDLWYIQHQSLLLNLSIILKTIPALIKPEGLYASREKFDFPSPSPPSPSPAAGRIEREHKTPVRMKSSEHSLAG